MTEASLSEQEFEERADAALRELLTALDRETGFEVELASGILTIEFDDGAKYVINSHRAARQIWMAAELSAWHFDFVASTGRWTAPKSGDELWATVAGALGRKIGHPVDLRSGS